MSYLYVIQLYFQNILARMTTWLSVCALCEKTVFNFSLESH